MFTGLLIIHVLAGLLIIYKFTGLLIVYESMGKIKLTRKETHYHYVVLTLSALAMRGYQV